MTNTIQKKIANTLDLGSLPPEEQQEIILRVGTLIYQNVMIRVMETMPAGNQDEFEKLLDQNAPPEKIFSFLSEKVKDFEKIIEEEAAKLKNKTDSIMGQIGK